MSEGTNMEGGGVAVGGCVPKRAGWIALALVLITVGLYSRTLSSGFVNYDDTVYVTENAHVQEGLTAGSIGWAFTTYDSGNWHPLTWLSLELDRQVYGTKAAGFHLTNVLLHAANAGLLFWLCVGLTGATWRSAVVAAIFAWHPLHVESVAWVSERKDVLSVFFGLWSLLAYGAYAKLRVRGGAMGKGREKWFYAFALVALTLGLMAKGMLVTLPFVFLLLDFWPLGRATAGRNAWFDLVVEKIPFFVVIALGCVMTYAAQAKGGNVIVQNEFPLTLRVTNAVVSYLRYVERAFWPTHLAVFYPYMAWWPKSVVLAAAGMLVAVTVGAWQRRVTQPYFIVGWLWFVGTLVPVIGIVQVGFQSMADRYMYLPLIGLAILVVWEGEDLLRRWMVPKFAVTAGAVCVLSAMGVVTWTQVNYWCDSEALFRRAVMAVQDNHIARTGLGLALRDKGRTNEAMREFERAVEIGPGYFFGRLYLGEALLGERRWEEAVTNLTVAVGALDKSAEAHTKLGVGLSRLGRMDEAAAQFVVALQIDAGSAEAHFELGRVRVKAGECGLAVMEFETALRLKPEMVEAMTGLAGVLATDHEARNRNGAEAVRLAERACELTGGKDVECLVALDEAYAEAGRFEEAMATAKKVRELAAGKKDVFEAAERRIKLYTKGTAFHEAAK